MSAAFFDFNLYIWIKISSFSIYFTTLNLVVSLSLSLSLYIYIYIYLFIYSLLALEILLSAHIVFSMGLRTNSDYFATQRQLIGLIIETVCVCCAMWTEYFGL